MRIRQGPAGRTLHEMRTNFPDARDELIGVVDTAELAALIVTAVNEHHARVNGCYGPDCHCRYCVAPTLPPQKLTPSALARWEERQSRRTP